MRKQVRSLFFQSSSVVEAGYFAVIDDVDDRSQFTERACRSFTRWQTCSGSKGRCSVESAGAVTSVRPPTPKGFGTGINFFVYTNNNPVNANDPSGLCPGCIAALVETASGWGTALLAAGRTALNAATTFVRTNSGLVAGTVGGTSGAAGYYSTTPNPNFRDAGIATGIGVAQGVASVLLPGSGTFAQGAGIGVFADAVSQKIGMALEPNKSFNYLELAGATFGGGAATKLTGAFGTTFAAGLGSHYSWASVHIRHSARAGFGCALKFSTLNRRVRRLPEHEYFCIRCSGKILALSKQTEYKPDAIGLCQIIRSSPRSLGVIRVTF